MEDFFDDFNNDDFMDKDSFKDSLEGEMDEQFTGDADHEEKLDKAE